MLCFEKKKYVALLVFMLATGLQGQFATRYNINEKIEAEDLDITRLGNTQWLTVGTGIGWVADADSIVTDLPGWTGDWYPSEFIYSRCGNRHWLCEDDRVIERCAGECADEYIEMDVNIAADGFYILYAFMASLSDIATIEENTGCQ